MFLEKFEKHLSSIAQSRQNICCLSHFSGLLFWSSIGPGKENYPELRAEGGVLRDSEITKKITLGRSKWMCYIQVRGNTWESTWSEEKQRRTSWPLVLMVMGKAIHPYSGSEEGVSCLTFMFFLVRRLILCMN